MICNRWNEDDFLIAAAGGDEAASKDLSEHVASGCPRCTGRLAEAAAMIDQLPLALEPVQPSDQALERLRAKIREGPGHAEQQPGAVDAASALQQGQRPAPPITATRGFWFYVPLAISAAALIACALLLRSAFAARRRYRSNVAQQALAIDHLQSLLKSRSKILGRNQKLQAQVKLLEKRAAATKVRLAHERALVRDLSSRPLKLAALHRPGTPGVPHAALIVSRHMGYFTVTHLKQLPAGKTYELWLILASQKKIPAGTFNVDRKGAAVVHMPMHGLPPKIILTAVTIEPAGGVAQPTGKIQLLGSVVQVAHS